MDFALIPKFAIPVLGISGTAGIPAASYVGYMAWDEANIDLERYLGRQKKRWKPISSNVAVGGTANALGETYFKEKRNPCFQKGFGSNTDGNVNLPYTLGVINTGASHGETESVTVDSSSSSAPAKGCAYMMISKVDSNNKAVFHSVLTIKNDKNGLALLASWENNGNTNSQRLYLLYTLFLLKKESNDWKVKVGYAGLDKKLTNKAKLPSTQDVYNASSDSSETITETPYILAPDNQVGSGGETITTKDQIKNQYYAGIGEQNNDTNNTKEFFQSVVVKEKKDSSEAELLGISNYDFNSPSDAGYKDVKVFAKDGGFKRLQDSDKDISSKLKSGLEPFKNKKGKGTKFQDYCRPFEKQRKSRSFNLNDPNTKRMLEHCYS